MPDSSMKRLICSSSSVSAASGLARALTVLDLLQSLWSDKIREAQTVVWGSGGDGGLGRRKEPSRITAVITAD
jgi:hypothetical protein